MPYPRLHREEPEAQVPPIFRLSDFAGRRAGEDRLHDAERAVERVQECLDRLDELLDPYPFRRVEFDDDGPRAA